MKIEQEETIDEIVEILKAKKVALWCGAGISRNSGIPVVTEMIDYLLEKMAIDKEDADVITKPKLQVPFEVFMEKIGEELSLKKLFKIYNSGTLNLNHIYISKLLKNGFVSKVYTTNFDELIETALNKDDTKYSVDDCSASEIVENANIIKLHGTISGNMMATLKSVSNRNWLTKVDPYIQKLMNSQEIDYVIVIGYSFSDSYDLNPIIARFSNPKIKFIVINHSHDGYSKSDLRSHPILSKFDGMMVNINTDVFMTDLNNKLINQSIEKSEIQFKWKEVIDEWVLNYLSKEPFIFQNWIVRIFQLLMRIDLANKYLIRCLNEVANPEIKIGIEISLVNNFLQKDLRDLSKAQDLMISVDQKQIHFSKIEMRTLINRSLTWANFYFIKAVNEDNDELGMIGEKEAVRACDLSLEEFIKAQNEPDKSEFANLYCDSLVTLARYRRGELSKVIDLLDEVIKIASVNGFLYKKIGALINKGWYLNLYGYYEDGIKYTELALTLSEQCNDVQGIELARKNISQIKAKLDSSV